MLPKREIEINETIVNQLIMEQFPQLSQFSVSFLGSGWDNVNYRLGTEYIIRIPRRKIAANLLINEIEWLPKIKKEVPIPISAAIFIGQPNGQIPWKWVITPWFDGTTADQNNLGIEATKQLAIFLKALHQLPTENLPYNAFRAVPISGKVVEIKDRMAYLKSNTNFITPKIEQLWEIALSEKKVAAYAFIHGDLHPFNVIQNNGKIQAIIDWGDLTKGNPALDLAAFWLLFEDEKIRKIGLEIYQATEPQINMAIGWAIFYGTFFLYEGMIQNRADFTNLGNFVLKNLNK